MKQIRISLRKTIAFNPELAEIFGDVEKALYIQQLYFWSDKGEREDGYFYKTKEEIQQETALTRYQQDRCRKYFERTGILKTRLIKANGAPTLHYFVDADKLQEIIDNYEKASNNRNSKKLTNPMDRNLLIQKQGSNDSITESTTESTTENKKSISCSGKNSATPPSRKKDLKTSSLKEKSLKKKREEEIPSGAVELTRYFYNVLRPDLPKKVIFWKKEVRSMGFLLKKFNEKEIRAYIDAIKNCKKFYCLNCSSPTYMYSHLQEIYQELYKGGTK